MKQLRDISCDGCHLKCDLWLTAREMNMTDELKPVNYLYRKHEAISRQGDEITHAMVLLEGNAKMYIDGINRKSIILNILIPSNYIGLMAVFGSARYKYNIEAITDCTTCHVDIVVVKKMYNGNQNFMLKLNTAIGESVSSIMSKLISLNQKQIRGKVAESLLYLSQLYDSEKYTLTLTRKELGELSAISEENTVRVLAEFRKEGIIEIRGREFEIRKPDLLRKINSIG